MIIIIRGDLNPKYLLCKYKEMLVELQDFWHGFNVKNPKTNYIPIPKCGVPNIQLLIKIKEKNLPREWIYLRIFFTLKKCRKKIGLRWYH